MGRSDPGLDFLFVHTAATWALVGLIWVVQLVQYPSFLRVGAAESARFHAHHSSRITWVVMPLMFAELATGLALLARTPEGLGTGLLGVGLALLAVNWLATGLVAVPLHRRLGAGSEPDARAAAARSLVATNWIRTAAWSARGLWTWLAWSAVLAPGAPGLA